MRLNREVSGCILGGCTFYLEECTIIWGEGVQRILAFVRLIRAKVGILLRVYALFQSEVLLIRAGVRLFERVE